MTLKEARKAKQMSKFDACVLLNVSVPTLSLWERGISTPTPENQDKIRAVFGEIDELKEWGGE